MGAQLNSYLMSEDARSQADFYVESLGGEILSLKTFSEAPGTPEAAKDKVMHLSLMVAGRNMLMISDSFEPVSSSRSISLALTYDNESEAREAYAKLGEGGENKYPFALQPWGAYYGEVIDKFGVTWMITKP
ncbi:VOC family protein [Peribacillus frigoritolerans]|uniref:VOC family protein n=1 Tax=Peribacillus frigoritolerans TaxID=450367 RepID=UPI000FDC8268|nr:VOC family protein [Peribacillus frigoritolerans]AZV59877.1 VOC family protein [Peribacillus frigoritolerans]